MSELSDIQDCIDNAENQVRDAIESTRFSEWNMGRLPALLVNLLDAIAVIQGEIKTVTKRVEER